MGLGHLYVAEYPGLATTDQSDSVPLLSAPPLAEYVVAGGAAIAFQPNTEFVEISTPSICSVAIVLLGNTATTNNKRLAANERLIMRVPTNPSLYGIAVVSNT